MSTTNPLKRRYQVFVSSTYEDLKEERQHVIQALLETKCIPLGMELFPAASIDQWNLIKQIIDECDYYLIIVAGRYGSIGSNGISYTEAEFDYAHQIKKPVIGFYHKSVATLQGFKLEKTDAGKSSLDLFTQKVKKHTCKGWSSPEGLGSAVKSAIIHQLEFNPQPGWIKADTIESLNLDDEKADKKSRNFKLPGNLHDFKSIFNMHEKAVLNLNITVDFEAKECAPICWRIDWDDLIIYVKNCLMIGRNLDYIVKILVQIANVQFADEIKKIEGYWYSSIDGVEVEVLLKVLMSKKLIRIGLHSNGYDWRFTPKGLQYLAEMEAHRHFLGQGTAKEN